MFILRLVWPAFRKEEAELINQYPAPSDRFAYLGFLTFIYGKPSFSLLQSKKAATIFDISALFQSHVVKSKQAGQLVYQQHKGKSEC